MDDMLLIKVTAVLLVANAIYATFAHRKARLTIYVDWTDAAMTGLSPVIGLVIFGIFAFFGASDSLSKTAGVLCFLVLMMFSVRLTWRANRSLVDFVSAAAAKYTVFFSFYLLLWIMLGGSKRAKYERRATHAKRDAAALTAVVASYAGWSAWVSRSPCFTPVGHWFAGDSTELLNASEGMAGVYVTKE